MKRGHLITLTLIVIIAFALFFLFSKQPSMQQVVQSEKRMTEIAGSALELPALSPDDHPVIKRGFTLVYSKKDEEPKWVAYELSTRNYVKRAKRSDRFEPDPAITTGTATNEDYRHSGYDRGHLAPAADMELSFRYINSSSYKYLREILRKLTVFHKKGFQIEVVWKYQTDDEDLLEEGQVLLGLPDIKLTHRFEAVDNI